MPRLSAFLRRFIRDGELDADRRAVSTFRAAAELAELHEAVGFDGLAHALLAEAALDSGLTPSEAKRQIDCGLAHGRRQTGRGRACLKHASNPSPTCSTLGATTFSAASRRPSIRSASGELARIEIGPGLVTLIGGAPGQGKTALTMQWLIDALTLTPSLKALVCNVEMSPSILLDRQLARLADIDLTLIRYRRLTAEHSKASQRGTEALESLADRLAFVRPPFDLANVARSADAFGAGLILLDYIQRIGAHGRARRPARGGRCHDGLSPAIRRRRGCDHRRRRASPSFLLIITHNA